MQRELFALILQELVGGEELLNEVIEITIEADEALLTRYTLPTRSLPKLRTGVNRRVEQLLTSTSLFPSWVGTPEQVMALGVFFWRSTRRLSSVVGSSRSFVRNLRQ